MKFKKYLTIYFIFFTTANYLTAQFSLDAYTQFLNQNENLTSSQLMDLYSAGLFVKDAGANYNNSLFFDSVKIKYNLTKDEEMLLGKNGFVVTERLQEGSFGKQFENIYHKDLPVFISSDAILHAFHMSYDKILKDTEISVLINKVGDLLANLRNNFPDLVSNVNTQADLDFYLKDLDVYLTVAKKLLNGNAIPYFVSNTELVNNLVDDIYSESFVERPLFSITNRKIDFSQFKPRGHYTDDNFPQLARYFRTMMWFGKIELYLMAPESLVKVPIQDVQRQIIMSYLFTQLLDFSNSRELFNEIEYIIRTFVGEQDNVTLPELEATFLDAKIKKAEQLLDTLAVKRFQDTLKVQSFAGQKILSQILIHDPNSPDQIEPASAFMPFGQRFVIDSYVTGSVVFDKVKTKRMLPSTLDILFALGNDASAQLLNEELDQYKYSPNLAALRYLIDSYEFDFWNNSIYNLWLNSIRSLNPPDNRNNLPKFMQTAAWWQQKMNSQLSSWTELRHDNLLYAKQSYSGGATCSYPFSYVEPVPGFFNKMSTLAKNTLNKLNSIPAFDQYTKSDFNSYFTNFANVADTLKIIAQNELNNTPLSDEEISFLKRMLFSNPQPACGTPLHIGWYPKLYYTDIDQGDLYKEDYVVADYHTAPTDAGGFPVGWVKHAGTGPIDLAIIVAKNSDNQDVTFVGPVFSYYEYTSTNFYRLTDEEWKDNYLVQESSRPNWVNIYLADKNGDIKGEGLQLLTSIGENNSNTNIPESHIIAQNYPNPFNPSTIIQFSVPQNSASLKVQLTVYNLQGEVINILVNEQLPAGTYITKWNGENSSSNKVSSGVYFYEVKAGPEKFVGKMNLIR